MKKVLANIKRVVPEYDPQQDYALAGLVWFQGWNDRFIRKLDALGKTDQSETLFAKAALKDAEATRLARTSMAKP